MSSAFNHFIRVAELVSQVLYFLPWFDLVQVGKSSHFWRQGVQGNVSLCITQLLLRFMDSREQETFWTMLQATRSAIACEIPLLVLRYYPTVPRSTRLPLLDLITPQDTIHIVINFFLRLGFKLCRAVPSKLNMAPVHGGEIRRFLKKSGNQVSSINRCLKILLTIALPLLDIY